MKEEKAELIRLHMEFENEPIWINAAQIEHVEKLSDPPGTLITMVNETKHHVVEPPEQIQAKIAE